MDAMTIPAIDPEEIIGFMNIDRTDYGSFSRAQQIRHFEVEGYVVLPDMLDAGQIARLKTELADVPMEPRPYSDYLTSSITQVQWLSRAAG